MIVKVWMPRYNWGDMINEELVTLISGKKPKLAHANCYQCEENYLCAGSILQYSDASSIVWGTGMYSEYDKIEHQPKKICAVRGPLTHDLLTRQGIYCPKIYGDPVLLMPRYYKPKIVERHKVGFVLHWGDENKAHLFQNPILHSCFSYEYIDKIASCDYIVSSSLHGLIVADAYGIPNEHMTLSNTHSRFKYDDYKESKKHINLDKLMEACPFRKE